MKKIIFYVAIIVSIISSSAHPAPIEQNDDSSFLAPTTCNKALLKFLAVAKTASLEEERASWVWVDAGHAAYDYFIETGFDSPMLRAIDHEKMIAFEQIRSKNKQVLETALNDLRQLCLESSQQ